MMLAAGNHGTADRKHFCCEVLCESLSPPSAAKRKYSSKSSTVPDAVHHVLLHVILQQQIFFAHILS